MSDTSVSQLVDLWLTTYGPMILRTCCVYLGDRAMAEDALQETFLRAWQQLKRNGRDSVQSEKAWLIRIAVNVCRDMHRSRWFRHIDRFAVLDELPETPDADDLRERELLMDVCRLPEKLKQPLLLYYYHQLTMQETADALGVGVSTVHKRLKKAQDLLKTQWEED